MAVTYDPIEEKGSNPVAKKKIVDARADADGDITAVRFQGNAGFTPVKTAIDMAKRGEIEDAHVSKTGAGREYLRTNPDGKQRNNLDYLAGDI